MGGFDDSSAALAARPQLTTIRQPYDRISAEMVRVLLAQIGGEDPAAVILPTELIKRVSAWGMPVFDAYALTWGAWQ